jgi:hypothetical protein
MVKELTKNQKYASALAMVGGMILMFFGFFIEPGTNHILLSVKSVIGYAIIWVLMAILWVKFTSIRNNASDT